MNLKDSFDLVRNKRKVASPTVGFFKDLIDLDIKLYGTNIFFKIGYFSINKLINNDI